MLVAAARHTAARPWPPAQARACRAPSPGRPWPSSRGWSFCTWAPTRSRCGAWSAWAGRVGVLHAWPHNRLEPDTCAVHQSLSGAKPCALPSTPPPDLQGDVADIATSLLDLASLHELHLGGNSGVTGSLGTDLCILAASSLTLVDLAGTAISGPLPGCLFGTDSGLLYLSAGSTGLNGTLPETFSEDTALWQLKLGAVRRVLVGRRAWAGACVLHCTRALERVCCRCEPDAPRIPLARLPPQCSPSALRCRALNPHHLTVQAPFLPPHPSL